RNGKAVVGGKLRGQMFDPNDVPDLNMRNIHDKTDRNGKAVTGEAFRGQMFDPNDVPDLNMRNIHDKTDRNGKAVTGEAFRGQMFDPSDVPDLNMRNIHNKTDRNGKAVTGGAHRGQMFDPNDVPDLNMRNIHNKTDRNGKAVVGGAHRGQMFDPNYVPDLNMRNIHQYNDVGPMQGNSSSYTINYVEATPELTGREIISETNRIGIAGHNVDNSYVINYEDMTPDMTIREMTGHTNRAGVAKHNVDNSYVINYVDATPDLTGREIIGETNHVKPGKSEVGALRNRRDAYNSRVNVTREVIAKGRTPTLSNYNKGTGVMEIDNISDEDGCNVKVKTMNGRNGFTEYRFRNPEQLNREFAPNGISPTNDHLKFNLAKNRNEKWFKNDRINSYPSENLQNNPYVNNIVHKSNIVYN
ncbi:MAG: hypothetical protein EBQ92_02275, partial [Proteobacteria bacterium]|nr:hypothetical protein [Pseudomonadota bacterium]